MKKLTALFLALLLLLGSVTALAQKIKYGDKGAAVRLIETKLKDLGFYDGPIDGKYGYQLVQAVRKYQKAVGLKVDGVCGNDTLKALGMGGGSAATPDPAPEADKIRYGASGDKVKAIQTRLKELGYYKGAIDGVFVDATFKAVIEFQKRNGLYADGVVGPATKARLDAKDAKPYTSDPAASDSELRLMKGDTGNAIIQLQNQLIALKYFSGTATGTFDYGTYLAVRHFQKVNKLKVDGIVGPKTWAKLFGGDALMPPGEAEAPEVKKWGDRIKLGDFGVEVTKIQNQLQALGYLKHYGGTVDGKYGYKTYLAVRAFQRVNGIKEDGVVGIITSQVLFSAGAIPMPAAPAPKPKTDLRYKDTGIEVANLQMRLRDLKYYGGVIDGKYGYSTVKAVREFQKVNGLKQDGVAGAETLAKVYDASAIPKP